MSVYKQNNKNNERDYDRLKFFHVSVQIQTDVKVHLCQLTLFSDNYKLDIPFFSPGVNIFQLCSVCGHV